MFIIISKSAVATRDTSNISTTYISTSSLLITATNNISTTAATNNLSDTHTQITIKNPRSRITQNWRSFIQPAIKIMTAEFRNWNYLSLLVTTKDVSSNTREPKQKQLLTNILPAIVMEDEFLAAIFPFEIKELTETFLFSGAALEEKSITVMYIDAKIDGQFIKLILDSGSTGSIITRQLIDQLDCQVDRAVSARIITADKTTKTPIDEIDNLSIEINGITVPIKILVMEATQYQALIGNDWLFKINATLDWNTQKLQLSQNR
ncbi:hypothetical protein G9A89_021816 [Geosiphon pyriformis]|nr:hypothetical protein G9A89_021816 [Geosiphon pyriformis]